MTFAALALTAFISGCGGPPKPPNPPAGRAPAASGTAALAAAPASGAAATAAGSGPVIAEGVIFELMLKAPDGAEHKLEGFTRLNQANMVPGGNGRWNVDAYGRLYREFLIITYPQERGMGPHVIPASRIVSVQFGDGGILQVAPRAAPQ